MSDNIATSPEPRLILETGIEAQVAAIIEPVMHSMGYQIANYG
jgi:hypothetical protein